MSWLRASWTNGATHQLRRFSSAGAASARPSRASACSGSNAVASSSTAGRESSGMRGSKRLLRPPSTPVSRSGISKPISLHMSGLIAFRIAFCISASMTSSSASLPPRLVPWTSICKPKPVPPMWVAAQCVSSSRGGKLGSPDEKPSTAAVRMCSSSDRLLCCADVKRAVAVPSPRTPR